MEDYLPFRMFVAFNLVEVCSPSRRRSRLELVAASVSFQCVGSMLGARAAVMVVTLSICETGSNAMWSAQPVVSIDANYVWSRPFRRSLYQLFQG